MFLKCVHIFFHCNIILQPFVKIVNNLMNLKVIVCVCLYMWKLPYLQGVLFNDGSLDSFLVFSNQYGIFVIKSISVFFHVILLCHPLNVTRVSIWKLRWQSRGQQTTKPGLPLSASQIFGMTVLSIQPCLQIVGASTWQQQG